MFDHLASTDLVIRPPPSLPLPASKPSEADVDKFATLFTPATPRPSPNLGFTPLPEIRHGDASRQAPHGNDSAQQTNAGAFMVVPAFDDPLSTGIFEEAAPKVTTHPKDAQGAKQPTGSAEVNSSMSFFDQFAQDANHRSTSRRSVLLGELLEHEDDPLYFLKDENPISDVIPPSSTTTVDDDLNLHQDLDPDFFRARSSSAPLTSVGGAEATSAPPLLVPECSSSSRDHESPRRSTSYQSLSDPLTSSLPTRWMSTILRTGNGVYPQGSAAAKPVLESIFSDHSSPSHSPTARESLIHTHSRAASSPTQSRRPLPRSQTFPSPSSSPTSHPVFTHTSAFAPTSSMTLSHAASPFAPHVYTPPTGAPGFKGESYSWDKGFSEELEAEREQEEGLPNMSSSLTMKGVGTSGWGSGFGFGFTSLRGKGKEVSRARDVVSPSSSSDLNDDARSALRRPSPDRSSRSGSSVISSRSRLEGQDWVGGDCSRKPSDLSNSGLDHKSRGRQVDIGDFIERKSGNVKLLGRKASTTPVLTPELAECIRPHLPALSRLPKSWSLIYSLDQHGISLNTLYTQCEAYATRKPAPGEIAGRNCAMLVVMCDANGAIFGVWLAECIRLNKSSKGYFGGGESFLWKYTENTLKVFKCTYKNNYVALCEPECISFGGGDGHYGLYLDDTLFEGSSAPCPTFDNEPLCSPGQKKGSAVEFECVGIEVWAMGP